VLRQSKYVQSEIGDIYSKISSQLSEGKRVLFCGTPCQCAGLYALSRRNRQVADNLVIVDFICNSVPSPWAYRAWLEEIEKEYGDKIKNVNFRNKEHSWEKFGARIDFENKPEYYLKNHHEDPFYIGFLKYKLFLRPSCSRCRFKGRSRFSDLTLGDAWGMAFHDEKQSRDHGVSVVIVNTQRGEMILEKVKPRVFLEKHAYQEIAKGNAQFLNSIRPGTHRDFFFRSLGEKMPFSNIISQINSGMPSARIVKKGNSILNLHPSAKIIGEGRLALNHNLVPGSNAECILKMSEGSVLKVNGNFNFWYGSTLKVQKNAKLTLGSGYLNSGSVIVCRTSITLGSNVIVAPNCYIIDSDFHRILDKNLEVLNPDAPILIGDNVWIGQGCTILKGVTIGPGAVVAARSVVTQDVPPGSLVAGNPAKVIRNNVKWK